VVGSFACIAPGALQVHFADPIPNNLASAIVYKIHCLENRLGGMDEASNSSTHAHMYIRTTANPRRRAYPGVALLTFFGLAHAHMYMRTTANPRRRAYPGVALLTFFGLVQSGLSSDKLSVEAPLPPLPLSRSPYACDNNSIVFYNSAST